MVYHSIVLEAYFDSDDFQDRSIRTTFYFPNSVIMSSPLFVCDPKNIYISVIYDKETQQIITFGKLALVKNAALIQLIKEFLIID